MQDAHKQANDNFKVLNQAFVSLFALLKQMMTSIQAEIKHQGMISAKFTDKRAKSHQKDLRIYLMEQKIEVNQLWKYTKGDDLYQSIRDRMTGKIKSQIDETFRNDLRRKVIPECEDLVARAKKQMEKKTIELIQNYQADDSYQAKAALAFIPNKITTGD